MHRITIALGLLATTMATTAAPFFSATEVRPRIAGTELLEVGDLNKDGLPDLVFSVDAQRDRVEFQLNLGNGAYGPASTIEPDMFEIGSLEVADLNADGFPDVVAGSSNWSSGIGIRVYLGNGTSFTESQRWSGFSTSSIVLADMNGDDAPDLVYQSGSNSTTIVWRPNNGSGSFGTAVTIGTSGFVNDILVGDLDGDDDLDIVAMQSTDRRTVWYQNNGSGAFSGARTIQSGLASQASLYLLDLADTDGDDDLDLVVFTFNTAYLYRNNGRGSFSRSTLFSLQFFPDQMLANDFNRDGFADLIYQSNSTLYWRQNNGRNVFAAAEFLDKGSFGNADDLVVADMDGDTWPDLVVSEFGGAKIYQFLNSLGAPPRIVSATADDNTVDPGTSVTLNWEVENADSITLDGVPVTGTTRQVQAGDEDTVFTLAATNVGGTVTRPITVFVPGDTFGTEQLVSEGPYDSILKLAAGDLNGDGAPDVVFASRDNDDFGWIANNGDQTFAAPRYLDRDLDTVTCPLVVDLDEDGDLDVVAASERHPLVWFRNNGTGGFSNAIEIGDLTGWLVKAIDMNGDDHLDLIVQDVSFANAKAVLNDGSGNFGAPVDLQLGRGRDFEVADLTGDGILDLLWVGGTSVTLLPGDGVLSFPWDDRQTIATGMRSPRTLELADFNGDGIPDLVVGEGSDRYVDFFTGLGGGQFTRNARLADIPNVIDTASGDYDGDGDLDVAFFTRRSSQIPASVVWIENDGLGTFSEPQLATDTLEEGTPLLAADLDGDIDLDLITANDTNRIFWIRNVADPYVPPTVDTFEPVAATIHRSESATLRWSVTGNPVVTIEPGFGEVTGDSLEVSPTETTTYTISATNLVGTVTSQTTVTVVDSPVIHAFTSDLDGVDRTTPVTLSWQVAGADTFSISPDVGPVTGSSFTLPMDQTTTFTLTATNTFGNDTAEHTANVDPALFRFKGEIDLVGNLDSAHAVGTADVDGDGCADIIASTGTDSGTTGGSLFWIRSRGDGSFEDNQPILTSNLREVWDFTIADFTNDGRPDVASVSLGGSSATSRIEIYRNLRGNSWSERIVDGDTPGYTVIESADIDGDGLIDIIAGAQDSGSLVWFRNIRSGTFARDAVEISTQIEDVVKIQAVDLDNDGDSDLVAGMSAGPNGLLWFKNHGDGTFATERRLTNATNVRDFDLGDFNNDGSLDLVVANRSRNRFEVYHQLANGWSTATQIDTGGNTFRMFVDVADLDGDGDDDILHGERLTNWTENTPSGLVFHPMDFDSNTYNDVAAGDFDCDGDLDYVVARNEDNEPIGWLENLSPAPTAPPEILSFGTDPDVVLPGTRLSLDWAIAGKPTEITITPSPQRAPIELPQRSMWIVGEDTDTEIEQNYTLTATNALGTTRREFTLRVGNPPEIRAFAPAVALINENTTATLEWDTFRADTIGVTDEGDFTGLTSTVVMPSVAPFTTYELVTTNIFGTTTATTMVEVNRAPESVPVDPIATNNTADPIDFDMIPFFSDPDEIDTMAFSIVGKTNPGIFSAYAIDENTGLLSLAFAPWVDGVAELTIEVVDRNGLTAQTTVQVTLPELPLPDLDLDAALVFNRQTGLYEHTITITNPGARDIAGFDLAISNLPAGVCVNNASDCTGGATTIEHRQILAPDASVTLVLEYYAPVRGTVLDPHVAATLANAPETDPAAATAALAVDRCMRQDDGSLLIEFTATPDTLYEIQYSDDGEHWKLSPVTVRAAGNRVQWIDRGPPRTDTPPSDGPCRFYRVREAADSDD